MDANIRELMKNEEQDQTRSQSVPDMNNRCVICGDELVLDRLNKKFRPILQRNIFAFEILFDIFAGRHCPRCGIKYKRTKSLTPKDI